MHVIFRFDNINIGIIREKCRFHQSALFGSAPYVKMNLSSETRELKRKPSGNLTLPVFLAYIIRRITECMKRTKHLLHTAWILYDLTWNPQFKKDLFPPPLFIQKLTPIQPRGVRDGK